jgi:hypothetical protein
MHEHAAQLMTNGSIAASTDDCVEHSRAWPLVTQGRAAAGATAGRRSAVPARARAESDGPSPLTSSLKALTSHARWNGIAGLHQG